MNILQTPNEILTRTASSVPVVDKKIRAIIDEMKQTLRGSDIGVGLAAPQVGISLQIFLCSQYMPERENKLKTSIQVFINPTIISLSDAKTQSKKKTTSKKDKKLEGCLSIQHIWGPVKRAESVTIEYFDEQSKKQTKTFTGFMATIIQHEMDHLKGVLFTQRVLEQGNKLYREIPGQEKFEEVEI